MDLYIKNKQFEDVGIIDGYTSLIWTKRYNTTGDFEVYLPVNTDLLSVLKHGYYVSRDDDDATMIIEKIEIKTDTENGDFITVSGRSLESVIGRRIVWDMATINVNKSTPELILHKKLSEHIETLLDHNIAAPENQFIANINRKMQNFTFSKASDFDANHSTQFTAQYESISLLETLTDLCNYGRPHTQGSEVTLDPDKMAGFKLTLDGDYMNFYLYDGKVLTDTVIFSPEFDNLLQSEYCSDYSEYANFAWVKGFNDYKQQVGFGTPRGLDLVEKYVDGSGIVLAAADPSHPTSEELTAYVAQLTAKGLDVLGECQKTKSIEGDVEYERVFKYKTDWNVGDVVGINNGYGVTGKARIMEIVESYNESGHRIIPKFEQWEVT